MIATVKSTSPMGMRGMASPGVLRSPDAFNAVPIVKSWAREMFPDDGFPMYAGSGQGPHRGPLMRILELSCWYVTGVGLVVVIAFALT